MTPWNASLYFLLSLWKRLLLEVKQLIRRVFGDGEYEHSTIIGYHKQRAARTPNYKIISEMHQKKSKHRRVYYLGIYRTRSAITKPTVTTRFVAGRKGSTNNNRPNTSGTCFWFWKQKIKVNFRITFVQFNSCKSQSMQIISDNSVKQAETLKKIKIYSILFRRDHNIRI